MGHDGEEVGCAIDFCAAVVHGGRTIYIIMYIVNKGLFVFL